MGLQMSTNCIFVDEIFATSFRTRESCFFGVMFCLNMNFKETGLSKYDSTCRTFVISFRFRFRLIFDIFLFWTLKWKKKYVGFFICCRYSWIRYVLMMDNDWFWNSRYLNPDIWGVEQRNTYIQNRRRNDEVYILSLPWQNIPENINFIAQKS